MPVQPEERNTPLASPEEVINLRHSAYLLLAKADKASSIGDWEVNKVDGGIEFTLAGKPVVQTSVFVRDQRSSIYLQYGGGIEQGRGGPKPWNRNMSVVFALLRPDGSAVYNSDETNRTVMESELKFAFFARPRDFRFEEGQPMTAGAMLGQLNWWKMGLSEIYDGQAVDKRQRKIGRQVLRNLKPQSH